MPRTTSRLTAMLCALALTAAACSSEADEAVDAVADDETATTAANDDTGDDADSASTDADSASGGDDTAVDDGSEPAELVAVGEQVAPVSVSGESLDVMPPQIPVTEPENDPAIGMVAPELSGTSFDGTPVTITADGTPRVIMFVAHWCPHCREEIPLVKALIDAGAVPEGLEIVVVSTAVRDDSDNYPPQTWLEDEQWPGLVMRDSAELDALFAFGAGGFPFSVYLDSEHQVVARSAGQLPEDIIRQIWLATAEA